VDRPEAHRALCATGGHSEECLAVPPGGRRCHWYRPAGELVSQAESGVTGGAVHLHGAVKVAARLRPAGGGQLRSIEDVCRRRLDGIPGVLAGGGDGKEPLPAQPDDELLCRRFTGARRLPDEPGAAGGGGEWLHAERGEGEDLKEQTLPI